MADSPKTGNGATAHAGAGAAPQFQARVLAQYIKDLSFENPNIGRLLSGPGDNPNLKLEVNVNAQKMGDNSFESAIDLKAQATNASGVIYDFECVYAGLFQIEGLPEQALEPFLLVNCPALIFPFLRRLAADITREGGFPPLLIDPLDFGALYMQRRQQAMAAGPSSPIPQKA
jgi:preprotein translocase subunit SecB